MKKLGLLLATCDADEQHFGRMLAELTRLGCPFAVHFDRCCKATKKRFLTHKMCAASSSNDDQSVTFHEGHRQFALEALLKALPNLDWFGQLDTDETYECDAKKHIQCILDGPFDVVQCIVMDLWGDKNHYRTDGSFGQSRREKFFNLGIGEWAYTHSVIHAPKLVKPRDNSQQQVKVLRHQRPYVLHWGIMNMDDVKVHTDRWDEIYTKAVGSNPYGFYPYINDPTTEIVLAEVPEGIHV